MTTNEKIAFSISWSISTVVACSVCVLSATTEACVGVVAILTGLHLFAYFSYKHQPAGGYFPSGKVTPEYRSVIAVVAIEQLAFGFASLFVLDTGIAARTVYISAIAYWMSFVIIAMRRPDRPTFTDMLWVKWGFLLLLLLTLGPYYTWATFRHRL